MVSSEQAVTPNQRRQFERLVFFSDAVFAIAITLLVLDLRLPPSGAATPNLSLVGPKLFGFALSFFVIGIYWMSHHRLFGDLEREDAALRVTNLVFLATVVFLPFPTSIIAEYPPGVVAVTFYAGSVAAVGIMLAVLTVVAGRPGLLRQDRPLASRRRLIIHTVATPAIFLASIAIAQVSPQTAMRSWWLLTIIHPVIGGIYRRLQARRRARLAPALG